MSSPRLRATSPVAPDDDGMGGEDLGLVAGSRAYALRKFAGKGAEIRAPPQDGEQACLEAGDVKQCRQELCEAVHVRDDRRGIRLQVLAIALAGGQPPVEKLRVAPDHRKRSLHIVPGHVEDVFPQSLKIALPRDVTEHDDAALRGASRRT